MCMLCDSEKAYQAYMDYLDAMEKQGAQSDPDRAMDAALDVMMANATVEDTALSTHFPSGDKPRVNLAARAANPFSCDPVDE